jgi:hypothetical protein
MSDGRLGGALARLSAHERERVTRRLRRGYEEQRLSLDTFAARLDVVYAARNEVELELVLADLPEPHRLNRLLVAATIWMSVTSARLQDAWGRARMRPLVLPTHRSVVLGRSRNCDCVISEPTVSRRHALLRYTDGQWRLQDLASMNGTYVNGARVLDEVEVKEGDEVLFGSARFRLTSATGRGAVHHRVEQSAAA